MRSLDSPTLNALAARRLVARDLIWVQVKDGSNTPAVAAYWNDRGAITVSVVSGQSGGTVSRTYTGTGSLIKVGDIPLTSDLTIRTVDVTLSQVSSDVDTLIRGYNCRLGLVDIHRCLFDPVTRAVVGTPTPRLAGFIDGVQINTPKAGDSGSVIFRVISNTQELTRTSTERRSNYAQRRRLAGDDFFQYAGIMPGRVLTWGATDSTVAAAGAQSPPLTAGGRNAITGRRPGAGP